MAGRRVGVKPAYQEARLDRRHPLAHGLTGLWLLNEGGGTGLVNLMTRAMYTAGWDATAARGATARGLAVVTTAAHATFGAAGLVSLASTVLPTQRCTIVLGYRKRDATLRASAAIGISIANTLGTCGALIPYSDGVVYWDFGGSTAGTTRVSVSGLTFGDDLWAFTTGSRGMEIWQNGLLRASNAANPNRTQHASAGYNLGSGLGLGHDYAEWWYVAVYTRQLTPGEIAALTADPYALLLPRRRPLAAPVAPTTFTGTAAVALPALTASGVGTFTAPVYTGTAAILLPDLAASGTGTFAVPVYAGAGASSLPALTASGSGTFVAPVYSGNAAVSLAALTGAGSGTFTAPTYTGSAAPGLPALTVVGVGTFVAPTYTGSAALALPALTGTGSGAFAAEVYAGTAVLALPALTATGAGTFVAPPITGTAALALPALTATGVGTFAMAGRVTLSATVVGGATVGAARVGGTLTITTEE